MVHLINKEKFELKNLLLADTLKNKKKLARILIKKIQAYQGILRKHSNPVLPPVK